MRPFWHRTISISVAEMAFPVGGCPNS